MILTASGRGGLKPKDDFGFFPFSETPGSAPDARAYFLFAGKKKVAKEKATPGSASGCARFLALLEGPIRRLGSTDEYITGLLRSTAKKGQKSKSLQHLFGTCRFSGPLERCRATQGFADKGRALSEGQSPELRSPRESRVAQGTGAAGTDPGSPSSLLTFFLATQEESKTRLKRGKHSLRKPT
jgi:hypothetical protein